MSECFIVAGGPSLKGFRWSRLDGKFVIAVNRSYEVLPNAQIVYFCDNNFFLPHKERLLQHTGRLIRGVTNYGETVDCARVEEFLITKHHGLELEPGKLASGRTSTYAAINLAVHLGFDLIYLLGVDMKWGRPRDISTAHWHDGYNIMTPEYQFNHMLSMFDTIVEPLRQLNVKVINLNPDSNLQVFPKMHVDEILK